VNDAAQSGGVPDVTVAVCSYNRADSLSMTLESLEAQETDGTFAFEVLVVDDASTDHTAEVVARHARAGRAPVRYVRAGGGGLGAARNVAVRECRTDWIAFIDDDELAVPRWLAELYHTAAHKGARIVGGPLRLDLPPEELKRLSTLCQMVLGGFRLPGAEPQLFPLRAGPGGGNVLFDRSVFDAIGVFDTRGSAGEDTNLWTRAKAAGVEVWYAPRAEVIHHVPRDRLRDSYFRWNSVRWGACFAQNAWDWDGAARVVPACIGRLAKAAFVAAPMAVAAWLAGAPARALHHKCTLWRTEGYVRRSLTLLAPRLLPARGLLRYVNFRHQPGRDGASPTAHKGGP
jgi:glycosyltransferase involved in cell wall biosynthesis